MTKDMVFDILGLIGITGLLLCLASCKRTTIDVPTAYLEPCYSYHCHAGDKVCDCLSESRACQNRLNTQLAKIRELQ